MRVICIDAKPIPGFSTTRGKPLVEGQEYEVESEFLGKFSGIKYYGIAGYEWQYGIIGHHAVRFIPLSDISETEFERNYLKENV